MRSPTERLRAAAPSFHAVLDKHADAPALICAESGRQWCYAELRTEARLYPWLPDDKGLIALFADRSPTGIAAYLAALRSGHAVILLPTGLGEELKLDLLTRYRPETVISVGEPHPYKGQATELDFIGGSLSIHGPACHGGRVHPDLALLLSTSGSTGSPKCVRLSHVNIADNAAAIAASLRLTSDERPLTTLPLAYSYGLSVVHSHLLVGATLVATGVSLLDRRFWTQCAAHAVTSLSGVPFSWEMLTKAGLSERALPRLRHLTQAGGRLADSTKHALLDLAERRGWQLWIMYGQTEATARMAYVPPERLRGKLGAAGIAIPGGSFRLVDMPNGAGEVIYRGQNVMLGYALAREDLARGDDLGGVLATGDLGYLDDEGYLFITGRRSRMVKLYGRRIGLDELELWLETRLGTGFACIGSDECIHVIGEGIEPSSVCRLMGQHLNLPSWTLRCASVARLPRTSSGKKDYQALVDKNEKTFLRS